MEPNERTQECLLICYGLSILFGMGSAYFVSMILPAIPAAMAATAIAFGMAYLLQRHVCGIMERYWGPFEGLRSLMAKEE